MLCAPSSCSHARSSVWLVDEQCCHYFSLFLSSRCIDWLFLEAYIHTYIFVHFNLLFLSRLRVQTQDVWIKKFDKCQSFCFQHYDCGMWFELFWLNSFSHLFLIGQKAIVYFHCRCLFTRRSYIRFSNPTLIVLAFISKKKQQRSMG
jgi:hypothetical protein